MFRLIAGIRLALEVTAICSVPLASARAEMLTAAEFLSLSSHDQTRYVGGFFDGFYKVMLTTDDVEYRRRVRTCLEGLGTYNNIAAAARNWMYGHPSLGTRPFSESFFGYANEACPKGTKQ
jgi:hypothetical protein